jgi:hypothetical protein
VQGANSLKEHGLRTSSIVLKGKRHLASDLFRAFQVGLPLLAASPDALDLVRRLTSAVPAQRPSALAAARHPLFWPPLRRLTFLVDLSDRLEQEAAGWSALLAAVESDADAVVGRRGWHLRLDPMLLGDATKWRK